VTRMASLTENYSIWIKPTSSVAAKLRQEIQTQSAAFGGPLFEPHVTLLPDIQGSKQEIVKKCQHLAEKLKVRRPRHPQCFCTGELSLLV
jgi:hypothetical protein